MFRRMAAQRMPCVALRTPARRQLASAAPRQQLHHDRPLASAVSPSAVLTHRTTAVTAAHRSTACYVQQRRWASRLRTQQSIFSKLGAHLRDGWERRWESPVQYTLSLGFVAVTFGLFVYVLYDRVTRIEPALSKYPPEVADPLRRAVYFIEIEKKPLQALQMFRDALLVADAVGMHPFSDEVLGIRLKAVDVLETNELLKGAIEMLEKIAGDCVEWVEQGRRREELQRLEQEAQISTPVSPTIPQVGASTNDQSPRREAEGEQRPSGTQDEWAGKPWRREFVNEPALREKITKKVVGMKLKLAQLHMADDVQDISAAERALVSATEYSLKEVQRRRDLDLPLRSYRKDRDSFITLKEVATAMSDLADMYATKHRPDFASLLYMQALALLKEDEGKDITCAQVVLLNNVASQMAEQAQRMHPGRTVVPQPHGPQISREQALAAAQQWARMAVTVSEHVQSALKTEECDQSCLVALYNLGEIAEMLGENDAAQSRYTAAKELAKRLQFDEGLKNAESALARLGRQ